MRYCLLLLVGLSLSSELLADADAWKQQTNNNHVIALKNIRDSPTTPGEVTIEFFGHTSFRIISPAGVSMLFDPWRNDPSGAWGLWFPNEFPQVETDVVLSTHAHFDHDAVYRPQSPMVLDRMSGRWEFGDVRIHGFADKHVCISPGDHHWHKAFDEFGIEGCPPNNPGHMDNVIFLIETGGMRIVMWGDNRAEPAPQVSEALTDIDILIIPIDESEHLLSYAEIDNITNKLNPKIIIPAHYLTEGVSSVLSTLGTAEEWAKAKTNVTRLTGGSVAISPEDLNSEDPKILYFGAHHRSE